MVTFDQAARLSHDEHFGAHTRRVKRAEVAGLDLANGVRPSGSLQPVQPTQQPLSIAADRRPLLHAQPRRILGHQGRARVGASSVSCSSRKFQYSTVKEQVGFA